MTFHSDISAEPRSIRSDPGLARHSLVDQLLEQARRDLDYDLDAVRHGIARVAILLGGVVAHGPQQPLPVAPSLSLPPWRIRRLEALFDGALDKRISVETMAEQLQLSGSQFARACKNTFGVSPHALLIRRRLERSQAMMLNGRETLSQIALACGFADQAHFCRLFRQTMGVPPGRWRQLRGHEPAARSAKPTSRPAPREDARPG